MVLALTGEIPIRCWESLVGALRETFHRELICFLKFFVSLWRMGLGKINGLGNFLCIFCASIDCFLLSMCQLRYLRRKNHIGSCQNNIMNSTMAWHKHKCATIEDGTTRGTSEHDLSFIEAPLSLLCCACINSRCSWWIVTILCTFSSTKNGTAWKCSWSLDSCSITCPF